MLMRLRHPPLLRGLLQTLALPLVLWLLLLGSQLNFAELFTPGTLATLGKFLADFFPPSRDAFFLKSLGEATLTTVAVANLGMLLAFAIGAPLALLSSRVLLGDSPLLLAVLATPIRALLLLLRGRVETEQRNHQQERAAQQESNCMFHSSFHIHQCSMGKPKA